MVGTRLVIVGVLYACFILVMGNRVSSDEHRPHCGRQSPSKVEDSHHSSPRRQTHKIAEVTASRSPHVNPGECRDDNLQKITLVWCPPGIFTMGSPPREMERGDDENQVRVEFRSGFWLGQVEVTQAQWIAVMQTRPWKRSLYVREENQSPASMVDYADALAFCSKYTESERITGRLCRGWHYTLPTEAQWEYACRSGNDGQFGYVQGEEKLAQYAWFDSNANAIGEAYAHEVGQKVASPWNLYYMHGNVWEWCLDSYTPELPGGLEPLVAGGMHRVYRGGSWTDAAPFCRAANRNWCSAKCRFSTLGFRVVLALQGGTDIP